MVDYYRNFFEINELQTTTTTAVINALRPHFARHGSPQTLMSDNGPQYRSAKFKEFSRDWGFEHMTSSPRYAQSNGKAENAVKVCKGILKRAKAARTGPLLALLDWRNTPSEGLNVSPTQRLMSRRTRTLMPTRGQLLKPTVADSNLSRRAARMKLRQKCNYDKRAKLLSELRVGQAVRLKRPGSETSSLGRCTRRHGNRSYDIVINGRTYRRNRRQIRTTNEQLSAESDCELSDSESTADDHQPPVVPPQPAPRELRLRDRITLRPPHRLIAEA